jgi:predicted nucleotidyltransferase
VELANGFPSRGLCPPGSHARPSTPIDWSVGIRGREHPHRPRARRAVLRERLFPQGGLEALYLFGSAVRGELGPASDLDLAFLASRSPRPSEVFDAAQDLAARLGRDVDLVDLRRASTVLQAQVVGNGQRLFTGDVAATQTFEMLALSDYAWLEERRASALRAFVGRYRG